MPQEAHIQFKHMKYEVRVREVSQESAAYLYQTDTLAVVISSLRYDDIEF